MNDLWTFLAENPWIWAALTVGFVIWITAVVLVVRSPKFVRKFLWFLLTLLQFSWSWSYDDIVVSVGFPLGAIYVLGFWKFGPSPTAGQLAEAALKRQARQGAGWRILVLRIAYALATLAAWGMAGLAFSGVFSNAMSRAMGPQAQQDPEFQAMLSMMQYAQGGLVMVFSAMWVFLFFRPYWWGKLICLWAGLAWMGFGLMFLLIEGPDAAIPGAIVAGGVMLLAGLLHQIADPRFSGTWMRPAPV